MISTWVTLSLLFSRFPFLFLPLSDDSEISPINLVFVPW